MGVFFESRRFVRTQDIPGPRLDKKEEDKDSGHMTDPHLAVPAIASLTGVFPVVGAGEEETAVEGGHGNGGLFRVLDPPGWGTSTFPRARVGPQGRFQR